jgi:hypothetical protein
MTPTNTVTDAETRLERAIALKPSSGMALVPVDAVTAVLASLATLRDLVRDWEQSATAYRKSSEEWQRQFATLRAEMVAGVEEAIRKLPEPNLSQDDKVRYAFAGKMAAFAIVLDNLRPTETTDE